MLQSAQITDAILQFTDHKLNFVLFQSDAERLGTWVHLGTHIYDNNNHIQALQFKTRTMERVVL